MPGVAQKRSPEKNAWYHMIDRCNNPRSQRFDRYGARGIRVCRRWMNSYEAFLEDIGPRPSNQHSLERLDNDGNYEPGNVVWALPEQQDNNKSTSVKLTHRNETMTIAQWARRVGLVQRTLQDRIDSGWDVATAIDTPAKEYERDNSLCGKRILSFEIAEDIRRMAASEKLTCRQIGKRFSVSPMMVSKILRGIAWKQGSGE